MERYGIKQYEYNNKHSELKSKLLEKLKKWCKKKKEEDNIAQSFDSILG